MAYFGKRLTLNGNRLLPPIPTNNSPGVITYDPDGEWRLVDDWFYWEDHNHFGFVWVKPEMVDKHNLQGIAEPIEEDDFFTDWDWKAEGWSHAITIDHCTGVSKTNTMKGYETQSMETPHGQIGSKEFVCWWCEIPPALFDEPENQVKIMGWCDG